MAGRSGVPAMHGQRRYFQAASAGVLMLVTPVRLTAAHQSNSRVKVKASSSSSSASSAAASIWLPLTHGNHICQPSPGGGHRPVFALGSNLQAAVAAAEGCRMLSSCLTHRQWLPSAACSTRVQQQRVSLAMHCVEPSHPDLEAQQLGGGLRPGDRPGAGAVGFSGNHLQRLAEFGVLGGMVGLPNEFGARGSWLGRQAFPWVSTRAVLATRQAGVTRSILHSSPPATFFCQPMHPPG